MPKGERELTLPVTVLLTVSTDTVTSCHDPFAQWNILRLPSPLPISDSLYGIVTVIVPVYVAQVVMLYKSPINVYPEGAGPGDPASIDDEEVQRSNTCAKMI